MSYQTLYHLVSIGKNELLNLLLGQGNLILNLSDQKPITLKEFSDRHTLREVNGVTIHEAKLYGVSEDPNLSHVDGKVTIRPIQNNEIFECEFELHFQDHFE